MSHTNSKGLLIVVSGPAGVGKGTIDRMLLDRNPHMHLSVSATTRAPRPGEIDGVHYFFINDEAFLKMIDDGEFLEYMKVFNTNYYGTPRKFVEEKLSAGNDILLEIDVNGAMNIKKSYPDAVLIFIAPPSLQVLKERLVGRGTETPEAIENRFATASKELQSMGLYDYVIVNDIVESAVTKMEAVLTAEKSRTSRNVDYIASLQKGLE